MSDINHSKTPLEDPATQAHGATSPTPSSPAPAIESHADNGLSEPSENKRENLLDGLKPPLSYLRHCASVWLNRDIAKVGGLYFQSFADAKASIDITQWRAPAHDDTIPNTDKEYQDIVKKLVQAFKDISALTGNDENAYRRCFTPGDTLAYPDWAIEACAWNILVSRRLRSRHRFIAVCCALRVHSLRGFRRIL